MLVADESVVSVFTFFELDVLNGSELREDALELLLIPRDWEVLNVEVASLLGGLVSEGLLLLLDFSVRLLHGVSNVELLSDGSTFKLFSIELVNSFLGAFWSVLLVDTFWIIIADESNLTDLVLHQVEGLDLSELLEHLLDLILRILHWDVLDVDVVDELSESSSVFWLEFHGNGVVILGRLLDGSGGDLLVVEADESIAS